MILSMFPKAPEIDYDKTKLNISVTYPTGYYGAINFNIYVNGILTASPGLYTVGTTGWFPITVPCGTIQVVVTSVPSGLYTPSSQSKTAVGGDTLTFTFTAARIPVTYTVDFTSSQSWTVPAGVTSISAFLVGGGGSGGGGTNGSSAEVNFGGGGAGGGYTATYKDSKNNAITVTWGEILNIVIGAGGQYNGTGGCGFAGGNSQIIRASNSSVLANANGGGGAKSTAGGGDGGSGGGAGGYYAPGDKEGGIYYSECSGGSNGANGGSNTVYFGGTGQGTSPGTKAFEESDGIAYSKGGNGGYPRYNVNGAEQSWSNGAAGAANTGNGGNGGCSLGSGGAGGSGIILVRYTV